LIAKNYRSLFRVYPIFSARRAGKALRLVTILCTLLLAGCGSQPPAPPAIEAEPEQRGETRAKTSFERLIDSVTRQYGPIAANRVRRWLELIESGRTKTNRDRLYIANDFFNGAAFTTDREIWQTEDYWANPIEFMGKDAGDCEEFAIAKYFTLEMMGLDTDKLRIVYVKSLTLNQPHMVLTYYAWPSSDPLVLDNIRKDIVPASKREDLVPVYSFNGETLWLAKSRYEQLAAGTPAQLKQWQRIIRQMRDYFGPATSPTPLPYP